MATRSLVNAPFLIHGRGSGVVNRARRLPLNLVMYRTSCMRISAPQINRTWYYVYKQSVLIPPAAMHPLTWVTPISFRHLCSSEQPLYCNHEIQSMCNCKRMVEDKRCACILVNLGTTMLGGK